MDKLWLREHKHGSLLLLYIQPGASKTEIVGIHGDRLKVKIKAPPVDGAANQELVKFFAESLGVGKSKVHLLKGESSRQKDLLIELSPDQIISVYSSY